jgi:hypothetical protein
MAPGFEYCIANMIANAESIASLVLSCMESPGSLGSRPSAHGLSPWNRSPDGRLHVYQTRLQFRPHPQSQPRIEAATIMERSFLA